VAAPDRTEDVAGEDNLTSLYAKNRPWGMELVAIEVQPAKRFVAFAFQVFNDLSDKPLDSLPLIEIVRMMAEKFGLNFAIGMSDTRRFFLNEKFAIPHGVSAPHFIKVNNARNDPYQYSCSLKVGTDGMIHVGTAFCLNTAKYGQWVKSHQLA
jgi:hypothetical protein